MTSEVDVGEGIGLGFEQTTREASWEMAEVAEASDHLGYQNLLDHRTV
jgi:hypothetical protein